MKLPLTLSFYIIRQFLWSFLIVFSVFATLIILMDSVELIRKSAGRDIPIYITLEMVILKFPLLIQILMPFIVLVSAVLAYTSLARRQELVIIRSAGVSAWEFLLPSVICAFVIGVFVVTIFNPVACIMLGRYEMIEARYFYNKKNLLEISDQGLWIRQEVPVEMESVSEEDGQEKKVESYNVIIHAKDVSGEDKVNLKGVTTFAFDGKNIFKFRVDADTASLEEKSWEYDDVLVTYPDGRKEYLAEYFIPTNVNSDDIQRSFSDPETISFWELPIFISKLNKSGFSDVSHVIHYHKLLSSPFFYGVMVLIGALFSLRAPRQGRVGYSISLSILLGFVIYFISNLVASIGLSGSLPVVVAAWSPVLMTGFLGFLILLHLEDG